MDFDGLDCLAAVCALARTILYDLNGRAKMFPRRAGAATTFRKMVALFFDLKPL
jgi:hypothetical protein